MEDLDSFVLRINMGNAAMQTNHHVAEALTTVARQVDEYIEAGPIRDLNGNTVGRFAFDVQDVTV